MTDLRVLIADDDEPVLRLLDRIMSKQEGVVCTPQDLFPSCAAAIEHYRKDPNYHLVLTDLNQNPSGVDLMNLVRENNNDLSTRVGIMTGRASDELLAKAHDGCDFFLPKPFPPQAIQEVIAVTKTYFARVGANPEFPKQWYVDTSSPPMLVLGIEGTADDIKLSIERFKSESRLQVDWSPVMPKSSSSQSWTLTIGNVYVPDVCTLQIGQNIPKGDEKPYTSIVSTGIGQVVTDLMKEFIAKSNLVVKSPGIPFVMQTEIEQDLLKLGYFGLLQALKDPELAKSTFAKSLRDRQQSYRAPNN